MPNRTKYNYYDFDANKMSEMSSFVIFGLLKDQLSEKEKIDIYKKITVCDCVRSMNAKNITAVYGEEIGGLARRLEVNDEIMDVTEPGFSNDKGPAYNRVFTDRWDPALKMFKEGLAELAEIMKKKGARIQFRSESEKNYYDVMQLMIEDAANERSWRNRLESDIAFEYAWNTEIKINLTAARPSIDDNDPDNIHFTPLIIQGEDGKVLQAVGETGMLDAVSGGIRAMRKLEDHITKGDVTRDELIREYEEQEKRLEKTLSMSKEEFEKLRKANAVQNTYDEFTNGPRGYAYVLQDVTARKELLKAGWTATDLDDIVMLRRLISATAGAIKGGQGAIEARKDSIAKERAQDDQKKDVSEAWTAKKEKREAARKEKEAELEVEQQQIDAAKALNEELSALWDAMKAGEGLSVTERNNRLTNISLFLDRVKDNRLFIGAKNLHGRIAGKMNKELSPADKALLSENISGFVESLEAVDPKLVSSSKQFGDFKTALKELDRLKKTLDTNDPEKVEEYKDKVKEAAEKATVYLRYKTNQYKGQWKHTHKRSELEAKRVSTVDAILNGLKALTVPGTDEKIIPSKNDYHIYEVKEERGLLGEYADASKKNPYDRIMYRYTGRGVVNGSLKKMKEAFARALTGYVLKKNNPDAPLDKEKANKLFDRINRELNIDNMTEKELREALQGPHTLQEGLNKQRSKVYAPSNDASYSELIKDMKAVYTIMNGRDKRNTYYNKVFDCVEKLAHLPEELDEVDRDKVFKLVEKTNQELFTNARERILKYPKSVDQNARFCFLILHAIGDNCPGVESLNRILINELNTARGVKKSKSGGFYLESKNYFDFDHYDRERFDKITGTMEDKRDLSEDIERDMFDAVKPFDQKKIREDLKGVKDAAAQEEKKKSKETPVKESEKEEVRTRRHSIG
jgi:hypothetical protein